MKTETAENSSHSLDDWNNVVASRYQEGKPIEGFRNYDPEANSGVAEFYRQNHAYQTLNFVRFDRGVLSRKNRLVTRTFEAGPNGRHFASRSDAKALAGC